MGKLWIISWKPQKQFWLNLQDQKLFHGSWGSDTNWSVQEGILHEKMTTKDIARILTKKSPQGCKSKQGQNISLGDQANGDLDRGDPRVANSFWKYQSDLQVLVGESQCNHGRGCTHFIPTKKKPTRAQTPVGAPSLLPQKTWRKWFSPWESG